MRWYAIALTWGLMVGSAMGQFGSPPTLNIKPLDATNSLVKSNSALNIGAPMSKLSGTRNSFGLGNMFPTIAIASWPPKIANVFVLPQKDNPIQPVAPKGTNPFSSTKFITSGKIVSK